MIIDFKKDKSSLIGKVYELPRNEDNSYTNFQIENFTNIQEDEVSRFDKTSKRCLNDDLSWDKLAKLNGIQDPFNLANDMPIIVLSTNYLNKVFKVPTVLKLSYDKISNITTSKINTISTVDSGRQERISKILYKFGEVPTELRKPIYLKTDETNLTLENGVISTL